MADADTLIRQVRKLLTPKTILHVNVPNYNSFHLVWAYKSGIIKELGNLTPTARKLQQNNTFNSKILNEFMNKNGLKVIESGSYFIKLFNHSKMSQLLNEKIINSQLLDGLYKMTEYMPDLGAEIFVNCKLL